MTISVEWLDDWNDAAARAGGALDRAHQPCLFDRLDWYRLTATHLFAGPPPRILHACNGASSVWLMLAEDGPRSVAPLVRWYGLAWRPIPAGPGPHDALLDAALRALAGRYDHAAFHPLAGDETPALEAALRRTGWTGFADRISTNWTIDIGDRDFAAYWRDRPGQLRNTTARRMRRHGLDIAIHRTIDDALWRDYEAVYAASWKPAEGSMPFLRALAQREAAAGTLRLGIARNPEGRAIASQYWLVENDVATIHKLAHREDAKAQSPGTILSHAMFRSAIDEDRVARIDFGLGDEPYKAEWMDTPRPVFRLDAWRPRSWRGLRGIARARAARLVRGLGSR